ncbi:MAG: hypothetical protein HKN23_04555, partial [Verrucomicrobiales bacterium]|nr:hypothetical protein [Verrucomicrobiales bacterium]
MIPWHSIAGPEQITSVETTTTLGTETIRSVPGGDPSTTTYTGERTGLDAFFAGGTRYAARGSTQVVIRRNTATEVFSTENANQVMAWNYRISKDTGNPPNVEVYGEYLSTYESLLTSNNIDTGAENMFMNSNVDGYSLNVERVDFIFDIPLLVDGDEVFAMFDRGGGGGGSNRGFGIAAITGINLLDPTAYSNPLFVADSEY